MRKLVFSTLVCCWIALTSIQAQIATPQPSPGASISQRVGLVDVKVDYSRPSLRGRKLFGEVREYGKIWRTGANQATKITFSDDVTLNGSKVPAGEYALLSIPTAKEWTIILSKDLKTTEQSYKQENDVVRFTAKPVSLPAKVETFTIDFSDLTTNGGNLNICWENVKTSIKIETDVDKKVMAQIKEKVIDNPTPAAGDLFAAAVYYLDNNRDLPQALTWMNKATETNPQFWQLHQKAKLQAKLKDYKGATETAKKSIELAKAASNNDYVKMNEKLLAEMPKK
ncbi:DUF2911 domain-containing protein [Cytophagaceae bacterium DM2B3-1]|uniref:DUF2911 domain-containing protein n=1 Tax=Xanthocytophaga flava TaxID=3048013 RepID=A0ABT7CDF5_9BACT|nr:DUF2911 domain-containing protein [Xanthocytophaga flavus]MDJ1491760.1 DUF2911 domain-containing protein [Xanthocytophaga flavus]